MLVFCFSNDTNVIKYIRSSNGSVEFYGFLRSFFVENVQKTNKVYLKSEEHSCHDGGCFREDRVAPIVSGKSGSSAMSGGHWGFGALRYPTEILRSLHFPAARGGFVLL